MAVSVTLAQEQSSVPVPLQPPKSIDMFLDGYAAQVEDLIITDSDVRAQMLPQLPQIYQKFQGPELEREVNKLYESARDELIERALVQKAFEENGGQIPDQFLENEIKRIIRERFNGDTARFEQQLTLQKKTREEYKEMLKRQMIYSWMYSEEVIRRARVTPQQVRDAYEKRKTKFVVPEQVKFSVILINKGVTSEDQAVKRKEAEAIRQRLLDGADFAETAKKVSEGSRANEGGAFDWMKPEDVRPELVETLKNLPVGQISEIIETENEFYIIRVDARQEEHVKSFEEVRKKLTEELLAAERKRLHDRWIERLKNKYYVNIYKKVES